MYIRHHDVRARRWLMGQYERRMRTPSANQQQQQQALRHTNCCCSDWTAVARDLCETGVALVDVSDQADVPQRAFAQFPWNAAVDSDKYSIPTTSNSAHCTGYHSTGGLGSRYNEFREGWVFSDGQHPDVLGDSVWELEGLLHRTANRALEALESHWNLPSGWFSETLGPFHDSSQWHLKRYVPPENNNQHRANNSKTNKEWLPAHTDPSLISVVILDQPGIADSAQGLCRWDTSAREWVPLPAAGHGVAILLVGSVLAYLSSSISACRHCVLYNTEENMRPRPRVAATLFLRPQPTALLRPVPIAGGENEGAPQNRPLKTFEEWNQRVARNYQKRRTEKL